MTISIFVTDSDGNALDPGECSNVDEAIRLAAHYALDVWPDYERAEILLSSDHDDDGGHVAAYVERVGPKGSRRVRVSLGGAGWVAVETTFTEQDQTSRPRALAKEPADDVQLSPLQGRAVFLGYDRVQAERDEQRVRAEAAESRLAALVAQVGGRVLLAVESIEACHDCGETFAEAEQHAFDPLDNDHCPKCDGHGCLTTYYGDPSMQIIGAHLCGADGFVDISDLATVAAERDERLRAEGRAQGEAAEKAWSREQTNMLLRVIEQIAKRVISASGVV